MFLENIEAMKQQKGDCNGIQYNIQHTAHRAKNAPSLMDEPSYNKYCND